MRHNSHLVHSVARTNGLATSQDRLMISRSFYRHKLAMNKYNIFATNQTTKVHARWNLSQYSVTFVFSRFNVVDYGSAFLFN